MELHARVVFNIRTDDHHILMCCYRRMLSVEQTPMLVCSVIFFQAGLSSLAGEVCMEPTGSWVLEKLRGLEPRELYLPSRYMTHYVPHFTKDAT